MLLVFGAPTLPRVNKWTTTPSAATATSATTSSAIHVATSYFGSRLEQD